MFSNPDIPEYLRQSMVERVARALCREKVLSNLGATQWSDERIAAAVDHSWRTWADTASVAIEAMREPNLAMRKVCSFKDAEATWPAMIDAALSPAAEKA